MLTKCLVFLAVVAMASANGRSSLLLNQSVAADSDLTQAFFGLYDICSNHLKLDDKRCGLMTVLGLYTVVGKMMPLLNKESMATLVAQLEEILRRTVQYVGPGIVLEFKALLSALLECLDILLD